ncbi:MAG: hypothetical protein ACXVJD_02025 [Mucilaginibacter sp.]
MKQKEVFKKIGGIIQELNDQYEYLQTVTDNLNDLELELFVSNARFLTDHIEILCKLNLQNKPKPAVAEKPEIANQQKFFEPVVQQMRPVVNTAELKRVIDVDRSPEIMPTPALQKTEKQEEHSAPQFDFASSSSDKDTYSFIREEPETIRHELILDENENWDDDEEIEVEGEMEVGEELKEEAPLTEEPVVVSKMEETKPPVLEAAIAEPDDLAEKPLSKRAEDFVSINQKISSQLEEKVTFKAEQPIGDLKAAITLNDKLLYVKDLFNGYNLAYSEAIEILNRFNSFEEAERFLKTNYVTKNNWESKPATSEKFYALLRRRYL